MKQRITFQRIETIVVEIDTPVDPITRANAEAIINSPRDGTNGDATPIPLSRSISAWSAKHSDPGFCVCKGPEDKTKAQVKPKRKA